MKLISPAKINLGLLIKGKRADGYHLLETLFLPVPELHDNMEVMLQGPDGQCRLELEGIELEGEPESNLVTKAYRALEAKTGVLPGVHIRLKKNIPAGAGLGGGSSNAASMLLAMNELCGLGLSQVELGPLAARLGADVPFFLYTTPMLATGTGTDLVPYELNLPFRIELLLPPIHSSTVAAYRALDFRMFDPQRSLAQLLTLPVKEWKERLPNDLEVPVFGLHPEIAQYKTSLYEKGAVYAAMSGSGSACFGLFES